MPPSRLFAALEDRGEAAALVTASATLSYAELARRAHTFGDRIGPTRSIVAIEAAPSEQAVIGLLGALSAGHVVALLPANDPETRAAFVERFAPELIWRPVDGRWRLIRSAETAGGLHPELALLLLTSGSTGEPRAVRLSHDAIAANAASIAEYLDLSASDRAALVLPLFYSYGLSVLFSHLFAGASVWLHDGSVLDSGFLGSLAANRCTNFAGVPWSYDLLDRIGLRDAALPDLRFMTVAGGRLDATKVREYAAYMRAGNGRFFAMYGQTEATARIAYLPPDLAEAHPDCIGVAIPGGSLRLIDDAGDDLPGANVAGELVYGGPNVMMGYAEHRAELARGRDVAELRTGDLAERTPEGLFRIIGRKKRISKIAGVRVSHDAVEAALTRQGLAAAVVGDDTMLTAVYAGASPPGDVRQRLAVAADLPLTRVRALPLAELPRTQAGKLDYTAIRALAASRDDGPDAGRAAIIDEFREVFFPRPVRLSDSFVDLGGDSLRHVELAMLLERRLGGLPVGWERLSVREISETRQAPAATSSIPSEHLIRALAILLVVTQHATLWPIPIGSMSMVVLIGFALARYRLPAVGRNGPAEMLRPLAVVLAPYFAIVAAYAVAWGEAPWASVFLIGNFGFADPAEHEMLPFLYWFVEVFAQVLLLLGALFLAPPVRRWAVDDPFRFGLGLLAVGLAARFTIPDLWPLGGRQIFTVPWVLPLVGLGWCAAAAETPPQRWLVLALALLAMPVLAYFGGNWTGSWVRYLAQIVVVAALLFAPSVPMPRRLVAPLLTVAAAAFYIYLFHRFAPELLLAGLEAKLPPWIFALLAIVSGVALGISADTARRLLTRVSRGAAASRAGVQRQRQV